MCGRYCLTTSKSQINEQFRADSSENSEITRYNIAPSNQILTIVATDQGKQAQWMKWGLIPSWVKDLDSWKGNLINARSETVAQKPSFRQAFQQRPCLIPASGFYEWSKKQPYYFHSAESIFAFAGIWDKWVDSSGTGGEIFSCTILTTKAQGTIESVHHRMPLVLQPASYDAWLGSVEQRVKLLGNLDANQTSLKMYPVHKMVNSPRNDSPDCIQPMSA